MVEAFKAHGLGLVLDIVPNHMGIGGAANPLWLDVLEWGPDSAYAHWFDIDWSSCKILVPFLGDQYGKVLESGTAIAKSESVTDADLKTQFDQMAVQMDRQNRIAGPGTPHGKLSIQKADPQK